jgi:hypothetical protein
MQVEKPTEEKYFAIKNLALFFEGQHATSLITVNIVWNTRTIRGLEEQTRRPTHY